MFGARQAGSVLPKAVNETHKKPPTQLVHSLPNIKGIVFYMLGYYINTIILQGGYLVHLAPKVISFEW